MPKLQPLISELGRGLGLASALISILFGGTSLSVVKCRCYCPRGSNGLYCFRRKFIVALLAR